MLIALLPPALAVNGPDKVLTTLETEHFTVSWGPDLTPAQPPLDALVHDLERAWTEQIDTLGWRVPDGGKVDVHCFRGGAR